jgi:hypothetical protein
MSAPMFTALARGGGGPEAMRSLMLARRSRTLLLIKAIVEAHAETVPAYEALADIQRTDPDAVARVLDYPSVGAWALRAFRSSADAGHLFAIAAAAAVLASGDPHEVSAFWQPVRRIALPGKEFLLDEWTGWDLPADLRARVIRADVRQWRRGLTAGWRLLNRHHVEVSREIAAGISVLTPLAQTAGGHASATLSDAFGCIFLSLPSSARNVAVTLAHELQHAKLSALMDLFPLIAPGHTGKYYAPWRTDPRPIIGLLHGAYAFLGVASFWRRQRSFEQAPAAIISAHTEFARWRRAAGEVARFLLSRDFLTPLGHRFVLEMSHVLEHWTQDPVPANAQRTADRILDDHRARFGPAG